MPGGKSRLVLFTGIESAPAPVPGGHRAAFSSAARAGGGGLELCRSSRAAARGRVTPAQRGPHGSTLCSWRCSSPGHHRRSRPGPVLFPIRTKWSTVEGADRRDERLEIAVGPRARTAKGLRVSTTPTGQSVCPLGPAPRATKQSGGMASLVIGPTALRSATQWTRAIWR